MTRHNPDALSQILARLESLTPLIALHRDALDRERRLPPTLMAALAEAGLFRLWIPRKLGGCELSPLDFATVVEAAARGLDRVPPRRERGAIPLRE